MRSFLTGLKRISGIWHTRNLEFFRDRGALGWNLVFPILIVVGFAYGTKEGGSPVLKWGVYRGGEKGSAVTPYERPQTPGIEWVEYSELETAKSRLEKHQIDFLVQADDIHRGPKVWLNEQNPKSELSLNAWRGIVGGASVSPEAIKGLGIRYVDWVLAGLIAMNGMYSALFGVGYVLVRYRKNAVLKRLKATPLQASQFLIAQIFSRLFIVLVTSSFVFTVLHLTVKFRIDPNYGLLLLSMTLGSLTMIALGLLMASRTRSEEFAGGLLNIVSLPMLIGSQVWFSLEGSPPWVQKISTALPLTPWVDSMRRIMTEGAAFAEVAHSYGWLAGWTILFFSLATVLFRWE